jgi:hypothetical protein
MMACNSAAKPAHTRVAGTEMRAWLHPRRWCDVDLAHYFQESTQHIQDQPQVDCPYTSNRSCILLALRFTQHAMKSLHPHARDVCGTA